jgi:hypothetical protein
VSVPANYTSWNESILNLEVFSKEVELDNEKLEFTWKVTNFTNQRMTLMLDF